MMSHAHAEAMEPRGVYIFPGWLADGSISVYARDSHGDIPAYELVPDTTVAIRAAWGRLLVALDAADPPADAPRRHLWIVRDETDTSHPTPPPVVVLALHGRLARVRCSP